MGTAPRALRHRTMSTDHKLLFLVTSARESPASVDQLVSLLAPHREYVDHHHPPPEVYLVLSPGEWRRRADPWFEPGVGGTVYNEPDVLHNMRSGNAPLFAFWCLPLG